jgi:hypothetical protein
MGGILIALGKEKDVLDASSHHGLGMLVGSIAWKKRFKILILNFLMSGRDVPKSTEEATTQQASPQLITESRDVDVETFQFERGRPTVWDRR